MSGDFDHDGRALKVASERLVKAVGGEKNAGPYIDRSLSEVQRLADKNVTGRWFTIRQIAELEAHAPAPLVTMALAKLAGGVFVALPSGALIGEALPRKVMEVAAEVGDVSRRVSEGLANDGVLDEREALETLPDVGELEAKVAELRLLVERCAGLPVRLAVAAQDGSEVAPKARPA